MPSTNRRPTTPHRNKGKSRTPYYDYRANSNRRDIRLSNQRRKTNSMSLLPLFTISALILVVGVILYFLINGKDWSPTISPQPSTAQSSSLTDLTSEHTSPIPAEDTASEDTLIYTDDRVPHYLASNPQWETVRFEWNRQDNRGSMWIEITIDSEMYTHYRNLARYHGIDNYHYYINDSNNMAIISEIVSIIRDVTDDFSYSDAAVAREVAKFVQDVIEYQYDSDTTGEDEYPRYPIETLYEGQGDCEDTCILMAALLKELGYEVGFLHVPGHVAVALRTADNYDGGAYYEINGHRYLFIESTGSGWNIGDIPEEFQNVQASFYSIP